MNSYKYYRLTITDTRRNGGTALQTFAVLAEFSLYDSSGNDVAETDGAVYSASSQYSTMPVSGAFDGSVDTSWHSDWINAAVTTHWIQVELLEPKSISSYGITPRNNQTYQDFAAAFVLEGSNNGSDWIVLDSRTGQTSGWTIGVERVYLIPYDRKYLLRSGSALYTVTDGTLTALDTTDLTAETFQTYGMDDLPDGSLLVGLTDPEVLYWQDSGDELPELTLTVTGTPPTPQVVVTDERDMSDPSILGIESATVTASEDVLFALSFDDGATWKAYDGSQWITLETEHSGMTKTTMESIGLEAWAEVVTSTAYRVRFALLSIDSYVTSVVINYINEEG